MYRRGRTRGPKQRSKTQKGDPHWWDWNPEAYPGQVPRLYLWQTVGHLRRLYKWVTWLGFWLEILDFQMFQIAEIHSLQPNLSLPFWIHHAWATDCHFDVCHVWVPSPYETPQMYLLGMSLWSHLISFLQRVKDDQTRRAFFPILSKRTFRTILFRIVQSHHAATSSATCSSKFLEHNKISYLC